MESAGPPVRIQANPFLKGPAPTFVQQAPASSKSEKGTKKGESAAGKEQVSRRRSVDSGRLQHDDSFSL